MSEKCPNSFQGHCMCVYTHVYLKGSYRWINLQSVCMPQHRCSLNGTLRKCFSILILSLFILALFSSSFNLASLHWLAQYLAGSQNTIGLVYYLSISSETGNLHDLSAFLGLCRLCRDYESQSSHLSALVRHTYSCEGHF